MKLTLALLAGVVGIIVTASAIMLLWFVLQQKNKQDKETTAEGTSMLKVAAPLLLQWTYFDYAIVGVFAVGSLFLFTDVIAVIRDAQSNPLYHYGYLLCGFVFTLLAMLFMVLRFTAVLSLVRSSAPASPPDEHHHPGQTDQAE